MMRANSGVDTSLRTQGAPTGFSSSLIFLPGLTLSAAIAIAAFLFREVTGVSMLSPLVLSLVLGILARYLVGRAGVMGPGVTLTAKSVLRLGIVLLGLQITLNDILDLGAVALAVIVSTLFASFFGIRLLGRLIGVERPLTDLIAAGTSVCGASAIIAINTVTRATEEDVAYALASVTLLGTVAMLSYPFLAEILALDGVSYALWTGASIHEVAQVAAAGFQHSELAGQYATVAKLTRVVMLAPLVVIVAMLAVRRSTVDNTEGFPKPWFVGGFLLLVLINSGLAVPGVVSSAAKVSASFMLAAALAAMGLQTDLSALKRHGIKPFVLAVSGTLFIAVFSLTLVKVLAS